MNQEEIKKKIINQLVIENYNSSKEYNDGLSLLCIEEVFRLIKEGNDKEESINIVVMTSTIMTMVLNNDYRTIYEYYECLIEFCNLHLDDDYKEKYIDKITKLYVIGEKMKMVKDKACLLINQVIGEKKRNW